MTQLELFQHDPIGILNGTHYATHHDADNKLMTVTYTKSGNDPVTVTLTYSNNGELADLAKNGKLISSVLASIPGCGN